MRVWVINYAIMVIVIVFNVRVNLSIASLYSKYAVSTHVLKFDSHLLGQQRIVALLSTLTYYGNLAPLNYIPIFLNQPPPRPSSAAGSFNLLRTS